MKIIFYENSNVQNLQPISLARPSFDILCGGTTLYKLLQQELKPVKINFLVRDYLMKTAVQKFKSVKANNPKILFLDGSIVPSVKIINEIKKINKSVLLKSKTQIVGAYLDLTEIDLKNKDITKLKQPEVVGFLIKLKLPVKKVNWPLFEYPWDVISYNEEILPINLKHFSKNFKQLKPNVFVGKNVTIEGKPFIDNTKGTIIIDDNSVIEEMSVLRGPLYIGKNCQIVSFTSLNGSSSIGDVTKLGGEVVNVTVQGYSNKVHTGVIADSYIGEWVNIGGGTSFSDLKNTYSKVKMLGKDTGRQYLGAIVGDYTKTAIGTMVYTGKVIGVNCLLYGTITSDVPSFTNAGTMLKKWVECPLAVAQKTQSKVMPRRKIKMTGTDKKLMEKVFQITGPDRQQAKVKKVSPRGEAGKPEFIK